MSSGQDFKPAGIHDIANALGVSIGTVDRALHNRPGISPKTRDRVLKTAAKLGYKPNTAARNLKLNRRLHFGIFLPKEVSFFFDTLRDGIRAAAEHAGENVRLEFHSYPRLGEGDVEAIKAADWKRFDGLILAPAEAERMSEITRPAAQSGKPVIFVATDSSRLTRTASIAADSLVSGDIAAELLGHFVREPGAVALFTGSLKVEDHAEKLRGFAGTLATLSSHLTLLPVIETHESEEKAFKSAMNLLQTQKSLRGIYINTANSLPVLRALREAGTGRNIRVIATDLFPELASLIDNGQVSASLYQRPFTQGRLAFEALRQSLDGREPPATVTRLAPHIVLRSNLSLFTNTLERDETLDASNTA
ncbi:MAG TPA: LacI family DNA-binding transcriptional regulator [Acidobacteriaceae bacterium]|jgi:LacI family transcriptional regulator